MNPFKVCDFVDDPTAASVRTIAACAIVLTVVGLGYACYKAGEIRPQVPAQTGARASLDSTTIADSLPTSTAAPAVSRAVLSAASRRPRESKALEFEMAAASSEPRKRFRAYELVHDCALAHAVSESARTESWLPGRPAGPFDASECGDLKPGQWEDVERRLALLRTASLAGVHGAWFRVWQEGPDGPLRTIPAGPAYQEWQAQARAAALASGDPFVYAQEAQEWQQKDPQRALVATVIYREQLARRLSDAFEPNTDPEVTALASTMDGAVAAKAIATGRAFVANTKKP